MSHTNVAIVTGASQGIGAELVRRFIERGYRVVANSRHIQTDPFGPPHVVGVAGDIADPAVAAQVVQTAVDRFGRLDTLINNAGIFVPKSFTEYTADDYQRVLNVNLTGFFFVTQQAVLVMQEQRRGHVVQMTTTLADQPMKGVEAALASLTKGGLNAVTRALAIEYAERGIRFNAVSPGIIKTPMHDASTHEQLARLHPMGRLGEVSDIADAVLYLEGAEFVTGEVLHVDGGQHAGKW